MGFPQIDLQQRNGLEAELRSAAFPSGAWERESRIPRRDLLSWPAYGLGGDGSCRCWAANARRGAHCTERSGPQRRGRPAAASSAAGEAGDSYFFCSSLRQVDSFDYKPELDRLHGKSLTADERPDVFFGQVGLLRKPDWAFQQKGQCGKWVSDLFPHLGGVVESVSLSSIRCLPRRRTIRRPRFRPIRASG